MKTAVLSPSVSEQRLTGLAGAVERVLRVELDRLKVADVAGTPALKLSDLELAVGCVGETPSCLDQVAKQLEVEALVYVNLDRAGDERIVGVSLYQAQSGHDAKRALRRASGEHADNQLLDEIESMLRELYGLPPKPKETRLVGPDQQPNETHSRPLVPFLVGGSGVAVLAAGVITGIVFNGTKSDYQNLSVMTDPDVMRAMSLRSKADGEATAANILFIVGAIAVAAGVALFFIPLGGD